MGKHRAPRGSRRRPPREQAALAQAALAQAAPAEAEAALAQAGPFPRILVVEDDPEAALFAVHVLVNRGQFAVVHTADPAEALRLAADEHWDLLLTDLDLPGMTGFELLAALRQVAPGLPVAVTSAHAMDAMLPSLLGDADEYLEKPLRVDKLIATVTALIGQGRRPVTDAGL